MVLDDEPGLVRGDGCRPLAGAAGRSRRPAEVTFAVVFTEFLRHGDPPAARLRPGYPLTSRPNPAGRRVRFAGFAAERPAGALGWDSSAVAELSRSYGCRMAATRYVTRYADAVTTLNNRRSRCRRFRRRRRTRQPTAAPDMAGLRAMVSRFASGPTHGRRLALAATLLEAIDPAALREYAIVASRAALAAGASPEAIAGRIPVMVLATALGLNTGVVDDVAVAARGYQPGTDAGPAGDAAVAALVARRWARGGHSGPTHRAVGPGP